MWVKKTEPLLSRVSTLTRDIDIAILSVRLSVCPSVRDIPVSNENGLTYRHSFFTIHSPNMYSSISTKHLHEIPALAINTGGDKNFLPISRYISQTIQDSAIVTMEGK